MNILVNNDNRLGAVSEPYPGRRALTAAEAAMLDHKYIIDIKLSESEKSASYSFKDGICFRREQGNYLTVINPKIQGYTVLKNFDRAASGTYRFYGNLDLLRLLKAMDAVEISEPIRSRAIDSQARCVEKYKILTEFIGRDFNKKGSVYCLRTDTAGRFFCLPNTSKENKAYAMAAELYQANCLGRG
jgi:hypothetical protein